MPFYEYQCQACGHAFDKLQKISDNPLVDCPKCQQPKLKKLISAAGFQLKGDGWYVTDFKDKKKKTTESKTADKASDGDGVSKASTPAPETKSSKDSANGAAKE